jgi:hypothetical protein
MGYFAILAAIPGFFLSSFFLMLLWGVIAPKIEVVSIGYPVAMLPPAAEDRPRLKLRRQEACMGLPLSFPPDSQAWYMPRAKALAGAFSVDRMPGKSYNLK